VAALRFKQELGKSPLQKQATLTFYPGDCQCPEKQPCDMPQGNIRRIVKRSKVRKLPNRNSG